MPNEHKHVIQIRLMLEHTTASIFISLSVIICIYFDNVFNKFGLALNIGYFHKDCEDSYSLYIYVVEFTDYVILLVHSFWSNVRKSSSDSIYFYYILIVPHSIVLCSFYVNLRTCHRVWALRRTFASETGWCCSA